MPQLRTEILNTEERKTLKNRAIGTTFFAILIGGAGFCMIFFAGFYEAFGWASIAFLVFFEGVALFIMGVSIAGAFAKEKEVETGRVTDKKTYTSSTRAGSSSHTNYYVSIDGVERSLMFNFFEECPKGALVELHKVKSTSEVFKVVVLEHGTSVSRTNDHEQQSYGVSSQSLRPEETVEAYMSEEERSIIQTALLKACFWRGALGGFLCWLIVYHLVLLILAFTVYDYDFFKGNIPLRLGIPAAFAVAIWMWLNLRTWRLFQDWQSSEKTISVETVKDVVRSNSPKPGPNSTISGTGQSGDYAYATTGQSWLNIGPVLAESLSENSQVLVSRSINAKLLLGVEST